jgi:hypothetical protein
LHEKKKVVFMKRIVVVLGVAAVMAAAVALTAGVALARASTQTYTSTSPVSGQGYNSCYGDGELFTFEDTARSVISVTYDANGTRHLHMSTVSVTGEGVGDDGGRYRIAATHYIQTESDPSAYEQTFLLTQRLIRLGEDGTTDDYWVHTTLHVTQNANGEYTAEVSHFDFDCG